MQKIKNIAIIAHVDHGKTTLVDKIIHQCNLIDDRKEQIDLILDNNDLERERGITIVSKNVSVNYKNNKINLIDTPGHADFGGEVERVLKMADGVLLLVDAFEGVMPQTRFVLGKALLLGLTPILVINKVDKDNCRPDEVHDEVFDLMFNLEANDHQLEFSTLFGSSKQGWMSRDWQKPTEDITQLLDIIIDKIPDAPYVEGTPQMQITSLDFSKFTGRIAIGRIYRGELEINKDYTLCKKDGEKKKVRIKGIELFEGLGKKHTEKAFSGEICAITGIEEFEIGDTIADLENPEELVRINIDEPTMSMLFMINNSPFFGKEGKFVTSRHIRARLEAELEKNLALRVNDGDSEDKFIVFGRGILHLSILIETMRREGYELQVGQPQVIIKEIDGVKQEPYEELRIDVPEEFAGKIIEISAIHKGDMTKMEQKGDLIHLEFYIPSRGIIGLRNKVLTLSAGNAIMTHRFKNYDVIKDGLETRNKGSMVSIEEGKVTGYSLDKLQDRGRFFTAPNEQIYKGQVIGEHSRDNDIGVNVIKGKKLTNMRASGSDDNVKLAPKIVFSLEECMEYIKEDELLEITPESLRIRKIIMPKF